LLLALLAAAAGYAWVFHYQPLAEEYAETRQLLMQRTVKAKQLADTADQAAQRGDQLEAQSARLAAELEATQAEIDKMQRVQEELSAKLATEIRQGEIQIKQARGELVVDLLDKILFDSGEARVNKRGRKVLKSVAETLIKLKGRVVQVGGHTDNVPIAGYLKEDYPSNWELSAARATHVVRFMQEETGFPGERLVAAGFSQYRPIGDNRTRRGRKRNRRIEILIVQKPGA